MANNKIISKELKISFNPIHKSVSAQLREQGFKFNVLDAVDFEDARQAIFNLSIMDLISEKQDSRTKKKLFQQIERHVKKENKLKSKK